MVNRVDNSHMKRMLFKMPYMISCEEIETFIYDYLEGDLKGSKKLAFELHIKFCRECKEYLAALRRSMELSITAMEDADLPPVPDELVDAVLLALKEDDES